MFTYLVVMATDAGHLVLVFADDDVIFILNVRAVNFDLRYDVTQSPAVLAECEDICDSRLIAVHKQHRYVSKPIEINKNLKMV